MMMSLQLCSIDDVMGIPLQLGREEPALSMDSSGKIIWAKHSEIQQANLKNMAGQ